MSENETDIHSSDEEDNDIDSENDISGDRMQRHPSSTVANERTNHRLESRLDLDQLELLMHSDIPDYAEDESQIQDSEGEDRFVVSYGEIASDDDIMKFENDQLQLIRMNDPKRKCVRIRSLDNETAMNYGNALKDNTYMNELIIEHVEHNISLHHMELLLTAIETHSSLEELTLSFIDNDEVLHCILLTAARNECIETLRLSDLTLSVATFRDLLHNFESLKKIELRATQIKGDRDEGMLENESTSIREVSLQNCEVASLTQLLQVLSNHVNKIEKISMSSTGYWSPLRSENIAACIRELDNLRSIRLNMYGVIVSTYQPIFDAIKLSKSLTNIEFENCDFERERTETFKNMFTDPSSNAEAVKISGEIYMIERLSKVLGDIINDKTELSKLEEINLHDFINDEDDDDMAMDFEELLKPLRKKTLKRLDIGQICRQEDVRKFSSELPRLRGLKEIKIGVEDSPNLSKLVRTCKRNMLHVEKISFYPCVGLDRSCTQHVKQIQLLCSRDKFMQKLLSNPSTVATSPLLWPYVLNAALPYKYSSDIMFKFLTIAVGKGDV